MVGIFGAIAEGFFEDAGFLTSLGRGGVDKNGNLREKACSSMSSAQLKALKSVANKLRFRRCPNDVWIPFKELNSETKSAILKEVNSQVRWERFGPHFSRASVQYNDFLSAYQNQGVA